MLSLYMKWGDTCLLHINSVTAALPCAWPAAVVLGLFLEARTGQGLLEQTKDHPLSVFAVFVVIALASYIPLAR